MQYLYEESILIRAAAHTIVFIRGNYSGRYGQATVNTGILTWILNRLVGYYPAVFK
jgi:hypothetical protein